MRIHDVVKDRYELLKEIHREGTSAEWLAFDRVSNCAVSLMCTECGPESNTESVIGRYRRLADYLGPVRDTHLVHVREIGEHDGGIYAVMESVGGGSIADLLRHRGPLSPREALTIVRLTAEALQGMYNSRLAHGALSPETVRVILDHDARISNVRLLLYAPVDQVASSIADDLRAIGALLYQMLTAAPYPEDGQANPDTRQRLENACAGFSETQTSGVQQLISRCSRSEGQQRLANPAQLMQAVDKLLSEPPPPANASADDDTVPTEPVRKPVEPPTSPVLAVIRTPSGRAFEIKAPRVRVGRNASGVVNDFDLRPEPRSAYVHRRHFRLEKLHGRWWLELEPGADHPTYVAGKRVLPDQRVALRDGDEINAAGVAMTFHIHDKA